MQRRWPTLDQQSYRMQIRWPGFWIKRQRRQIEIIWEGTILPSPISEEYRVRVEFQWRYCPKVNVISPELRIRDGFKSLPHVNEDGSICLHVMGEWQPWMLVADSTIPWISGWLYFYEMWLATGLWLGGGTHPEKPEHRSEFCSESVDSQISQAVIP